MNPATDNQPSTAANASETPKTPENPASAIAPTPGTSPAPVPTATPWPAQFDIMLDGFAAALTRDGSKPTTIRDYRRWVEKFLTYTLRNGLKLDTLTPADTVENFYLSMGFGPLSPQRNPPNAALKAFLRYAPQANVFIPELAFPPSVRPPRKKMTTPVDPNAVTPSTIPATNASPNPGPNPNPNSYGPAPAGTPAFVPVASAPPFQAPAPQAQPYAFQPVTVQPGQQPSRIVDRSQRQARGVLSSLFPQGGRIIVTKVSDGSDGHAPGNVVTVGEYTSDDLTGFRDIPLWVKERVDPYDQASRPLTLTSIIEYRVQHVDDAGRATSPALRVTIPNRNASGAARPTSLGGAPNGGAPSTPAESMIDRAFRGMQEEIAREVRRREHVERELQESAKSGKLDAITLMTLTSSLNRGPTLDQFTKEMERIIVEAKKAATPPPPAPLPMLPPPPPQTDPLVKVLVERMPVPQQQDPLATLRMAKEVLTPVGNTAESLALVEMRERNRTLEQKLDQLTSKPTPTMDGMVDQWFKFDNMMQQRFGGGSGGGETFLQTITAIVQALPETIDAIGRLRSVGNAPTAEEVRAARAKKGRAKVSSGEEAEQQTPGTGANDQQAKYTLTPEIRQAFEQLAAAQSDEAAMQGVYALVNAIGGASPVVLQELDNALRGVETVDDVQLLVAQLFGLYQQRELTKRAPGVIRKVAEAVSANFDVICRTLGHDEREIIGARESNYGGAPTPEAAAPKGNAPGPDDEENDEDADEAPDADEPEVKVGKTGGIS